MFAAHNLPWTVHQKCIFPTNRHIPPDSGFIKDSDNFATPVAFGTAGTVFMGFDIKPEFFVPIMKSEINNPISFYFKQFLDKLQYAHGDLLFK